MQDLILAYREDVKPGFLKFRAAGPLLINRPDTRGLMVQEPCLGCTAMGQGGQLLQESRQIAQDGRQFGWPLFIVVPLGTLELSRDLHPPHEVCVANGFTKTTR